MTESVRATATPTGLVAHLRALSMLRGWRRWSLAFLAGVLAVPALPPISWFPLLWLSFPILVWLLAGARTRWGAFFTGWSFGFGFFLAGLYWIAAALTVEIDRFFWLIPFAAAGLPAGLSIFIGLAGLAVRLVAGRGVGGAVFVAVAWTVMEWVRGHVLTGFPWNLIGYVWVDYLPVLQSVSVVGIYGLSAATVTAACLPAAVLRLSDGQWRRAGAAATVAGSAVLVAIAMWGNVRLPEGGQPVVPEVTLRLVQPNIAQADKRDPLRVHLNFEIARELSANPPDGSIVRADGAGAVTHVIWPETAVPYRLTTDTAAREALAAITPAGGLALVGAVRSDGGRFFNSMIAISDGADLVDYYDKAHLVPFGEYMPLRDWVPIPAIAARGLFTEGPGLQSLDLPGLPPVGPLICYEVIFPGAVSSPDDQPDWLLNLTNDAWYGADGWPSPAFFHRIDPRR